MNIHEFIPWVGTRKVIFSPCTDPDFLSTSVLDFDTKNDILKKLDQYPAQLKQLIEKDLTVDPTELQYQQLKTYLTEFVQRRNLSFSVFPDSFQKWITR
jgi:hypothetical protein